MITYEKFNPLSVSSKFAICGLPIRLDTYKTCSYGCEYCFSNNRKIMEFSKELKIGNAETVERKLNKIFNRGDIASNSFIDNLILNRYTWHCGGMSDPFQPIEAEINATKDIIDVTNKYGIDILFSTKSDSVYDCDIRPDMHTFQLSITNTHNNKEIEPNVPDIEKRYEFFKDLKRAGFKVGIRIQPFIPDITTLEIVEMFKDADHFTIEGLKLVPQNAEHKNKILDITGIPKDEFIQMGLLNLRPQIREALYMPFIEEFKKNNISYSIADNDMHYLGNNSCCCGDTLVKKCTTFNNTALCYKYGVYCKEQLDEEILKSGLSECKCNQLFTSNRQEGCVTVKEFFDKRFYRKSSPFSPLFMYSDKWEDLKER